MGRGLVALVAATVMLDGFIQLIPEAKALASAGMVPAASPLAALWALGGTPMLLIRHLKLPGALSTTALLGYSAVQPGAPHAAGCILAGLTLWLGLALDRGPSRPTV